jgi:outer membrane protein
MKLRKYLCRHPGESRDPEKQKNFLISWTPVFTGVTALFFFGIQLGCLADAEAESLPELVNRIVAANPAVESSRARVREAEAGRKEVNAHRIPMLEARGSVTRGDNPVYVFGSLLEQGRFGPQNFAISSLNNPDYLTNYKGALMLGVPVFTAFELSNQGKIAEFGRQQAEFGTESTTQQLRLNSTVSYLQAVLGKQLTSMLDERIMSGSKEIDNADRLRERGLVLGSDFYVAQSIGEGLKGWKIQTQNEQSQAEKRLAILAGSPVEIPDARFTDKAYSVGTSKELTDTALRDRPELRAARLGTESARTAQSQARSSLLPRADAFASLESNTNDFTSAPSNRMIGLRVNVPMGDPAYGPRRARAEAGVDAQQRQLQALEQSVQMDVAEALQNYQSALDGLNAARVTRDRAAKALELFRPLYRSGRQSVMEVLRAEEGLARAEANYQQSLFNLHTSWARLQWAIGHLDGSAISEIASHLEGQ